MKGKLVTCYLRNDLDGVACVYAYSEFLRKNKIDAVGAVFGKCYRESKFVLDNFKIKKLANAEKFLNNDIILVDASDMNGISPKIDPKKVVEIIDHRKINESEKFPNAKAQIEFVGAAATLIAEKFHDKKIPISKESAKLLSAAIVSNTINFKASNCTGRDVKMFKWLGKQAKTPKAFYHKMFAHKSKFTKPLKDVFDDEFATLVFNSENFGIAQLEIVKADKFVKNRISDIKKALAEIKKERSLGLVFLTCIDTEKGFNIFVTIDKKTEQLISSTFNVKFTDGVAKRQGIVMRKEITPKIKEKMSL